MVTYSKSDIFYSKHIAGRYKNCRFNKPYQATTTADRRNGER
jgi:hypothetical protein